MKPGDHMLSKKISFRSGMLALSIIALSSCAGLRANLLLLQEATPEEKAELLFKDGLERYQNDILRDQDLSAIPSVRTRFQDAIKLYPGHAGAKKYLSDLEAFRSKQFDLNLATASDLYKREKRTSAQDYNLVVAVKKLKQLDSGAPETKILVKGTGELKTAVVKANTEELNALQREIDAETDRTVKLAKLKSAKKIADNILFIEPLSPSVSLARDGIDKKIADLTQPQSAAEAKAPAATAKTTAPAPAAKTPAKSTAKPAKTVKAAHDYDGDAVEVLGTIDALIRAGKPSDAMNHIRTYEGRFLQKGNLDKLAAKKSEVQKLAAKIYQDGIASYNEEDYESARTHFIKVVQYDAGYEQAQAYLDRSETKLRALSGR